jgi:hypothetical protein
MKEINANSVAVVEVVASVVAVVIATTRQHYTMEREL